MKKILLLLLTVLIFTSCIETFRSDDIFVVTKKEMRNTGSYKYLYSVNHYITSTAEGLYYQTYYHILSNENYELGDTIKFINQQSNEK